MGFARHWQSGKRQSGWLRQRAGLSQAGWAHGRHWPMQKRAGTSDPDGGWRPRSAKATSDMQADAVLPCASVNGNAAQTAAVGEKQQLQRLQLEEAKAAARSVGRGVGSAPRGAVVTAPVTSLSAAADAAMEQNWTGEAAGAAATEAMSGKAGHSGCGQGRPNAPLGQAARLGDRALRRGAAGTKWQV